MRDQEVLAQIAQQFSQREAAEGPGFHKDDYNNDEDDDDGVYRGGGHHHHHRMASGKVITGEREAGAERGTLHETPTQLEAGNAPTSLRTWTELGNALHLHRCFY